MVEIDDEYWQHQHHHQPAKTEAHHQQVRRTSQGSEPGQIVLTELLPGDRDIAQVHWSRIVEFPRK